ncbi:MAG: 5-formyltetrahydrofolate cyclo-ligase [Chitinispirillaceae bacterium]|nr:5-formyltetrahydrofolate cyclo-ligase [Chitinispirillaceae bacterium]
MNTGFGFSEILLVLVIVVVFFGSKELPAFLREIAKFTAKVRRYSDRIKRELDDVTRSLDPKPVPFAEQQSRKKELRSGCLSARKELGDAARAEKSAAITETLIACTPVRQSTMIMLYADMGAEVITRPLISRLIGLKKRVLLPYGVEGANELRVAEVFDVDKDLVPGKHGVPEPREELRTKFFKSDLEVVICPGVAFDQQGGRLGRGRGYYDGFLRELRGQIPLIGLAFDCQMLSETLPFEYHDVPMDMVITESGVVVGASSPAAAGKTLSG